MPAEAPERIKAEVSRPSASELAAKEKAASERAQAAIDEKVAKARGSVDAVAVKAQVDAEEAAKAELLAAAIAEKQKAAAGRRGSLTDEKVAKAAAMGDIEKAQRAADRAVADKAEEVLENLNEKMIAAEERRNEILEDKVAAAKISSDSAGVHMGRRASLEYQKRENLLDKLEEKQENALVRRKSVDMEKISIAHKSGVENVESAAVRRFLNGSDEQAGPEA